MARKSKVFPPLLASERLYIQIIQPDTRMFRYLLEARDNLGYTSVVDRKARIFKLVFTAQQEQEIRAALKEIATAVDFRILLVPLLRI